MSGMGGNDLSKACPKCGAATTLRGKAATIALTCSNCGIYFRTGSWNKNTERFGEVHTPVIRVGTIGKIDGIFYEVIGFVVKKESKYKYIWHEYLLFNPYKGYAFLSEYKGHWNFLTPVEFDPKK